MYHQCKCRHGKTTVLIAKILYLHYEKQIPLEKMVVLTFTNKAAGEIIERLRNKEPDLTEEQVQFFGTFHSIAMRMLKSMLPKSEELKIGLLKNELSKNEEPKGRLEKSEFEPAEESSFNEKAEWTAEFEIIDPDEEQELALHLITEHGLKVKYKNRLKKRLEQEYPNYKKGKTVSRYKDDLFRLYPLLEKEKKRQNKMSFSDLLEEGTKNLKMGKTALPAWIIVDEVQDSDTTQLEFLKALKGTDTKIFAVGDPNQVIYSFRGTTQNMFFLLKNRFQAKELSLPVNYRSNASILEAANRFLQFGGKIQGSNESGEKIRVRNHYDPFQEAMYLADRIQKLHVEGKRYQDIAIFYRLQRQAEVLEKMFGEQGIPYEVSVKKSWKDIPVLNWLMKVLRFAVNPEDVQAGIQILTDKHYGDSVTKKKAEDIIKNQKTDKSVLYRKMLLLGTTYTDRKEAVQSYPEAEKEACSYPEGEELYDFLGLKEALHPTSADYQNDSEQVIDFLNQICSYSKEKKLNVTDGIREFLNGALLGSIENLGKERESKAGESSGKESCMEAGENPEKSEDQKKDINDGTVKLMTLHASKGLEFDTVFIIGVNPGLLPIRCSNFDQEEEERRLFFVGITRAKNHLELSYYTNPREPGVLGTYSNYLKMIPEDLLEMEDVRSEEEKWTNLKALARQARVEIRKNEEDSKACNGIEKTEKKETTESEQSDSECSETGINKEQKAKHPKYGTGIVTSEDDMMIEVDFPNYGKKQFIKAFQEVELI